MLTAGEKTESIVIKRDAEIRTSGAVTGATTTNVASVWAEVKPVSGSEYWRAQQINSRVSWKVRIDYRDDILPSDYVSWGSRTLKISAVLPDLGKYETALMCESA